MTKKIKSPLNYFGGKSKLLKQILPLFPKNINKFVDLFVGGCNVGINVYSNELYCNDIIKPLIDLYTHLQETPLDNIIEHIESVIEEYDLSMTNQDGYSKFRDYYNENRHPLDLFVVMAHAFNNQIRFNKKGMYNAAFGVNRSYFNPTMRKNLEDFVIRIKDKNPKFTNVGFNEYDFSNFGENDFVYCDPPYLITEELYGSDWSEKEEYELLNLLDNLDSRNIKFALSNVLEHKGKSNDILKTWVESNSNYKVNYLDYNYANTYHSINRDKNTTVEVLITNYTINNPLLDVLN